MKTLKPHSKGMILKAVDERGIFENLDVSKFKRVYLIRNHQINTIRAFHYHPREDLLIYCLKGSWKVVYYGKETNNQPKTEILSEGDFIEINAPAGNGHINLTENAVLLCCATLSLEEVKEEEIKEKWDLFGEEIWKTKPR